jgi:hypothetical protein
MIRPIQTALLLAATLVATSSSADIRILLNTHGSAKPVGGKLFLHPGSAPQSTKIPIDITGTEANVRLSNGTWQVRGEIPGYFVESRAFTIATDNETIDVSAWPATPVTGSLKVPEGEKVPDLLELRWLPVDEKTGPPAGAIYCPLDAEGKWQCEAPIGKLDLRARAKGYLTLFRWAATLNAEQPFVWGQAKLERGASIIGWVALAKTTRTRPEDIRVVLRPVASAQGQQGTRAGLFAAVPNSRGFFEFRGVAPGPYIVSAEAPGPLVSENIELKVLRNTEVELTAPLTLDRLHKVQMRVTPSKPPSADQWRMTLYSIEQNHHQTVVARTNVEPTGEWDSPGLRPGVYAIYVGVGQSGSFARREFTVGNTDSDITINIPLTRVHGSVKLGDKALPSTLWIGGKHGSPAIPLSADESGNYSGDVSFAPDDEWVVTVDSENPRIERTLKKKPSTQDDGTLLLDLVIPRTGVHGVVVDQKGNPISRSIVDIGTPDAAQSVVQTHGDANGNFELFGLTSGSYTITAKTFDGRASKLTKFSLEDDSLADLKLVVEGQPTLSGRVIANGNPIPSAALTFIPTDANVVFLPTGRTDANGEFNLKLPPGASAGNLIVATTGFPFKMFHLPIPDQSIVIDVDSIGGTLDADVLPFVSDENTIQTFIVHRGAEVNAQFVALATGVRVTAGTEGRVHIVHPLMEPGEYALCAAYMRELPALRSGLLAKGRCSSGVLAPYGSLKLAVPSVEK